MAFYDDKRFILSHIRHSFITCDDTGMCETVMLNENVNRYPNESLYHHPFDYDSDYDDVFETTSIESGEEFKFDEKDIKFLKDSELEYKSELLDEPGQSFDIMSDSYDMGIRRRSNTAQRLEKLRKERKFQAKTKVNTWKSHTQIVSAVEKGNITEFKRKIVDPSMLTSDEMKLLEYNEKENIYYETLEFRKMLFPEKEISQKLDDDNTESKDIVRPKSILTLHFEKNPNTELNQFNEYTRFDGRVSDGNVLTKRIKIFFKVHQSDSDFKARDFTEILSSNNADIEFGSNWINIIVLANARVCDLIGLICWHYTNLQIGPPLKSDLSCYALKMAEENGDVDNDFPNLNFTDDIKRYGFPCLALVENETQVLVTVYIQSEEVFSQLKINSLNTTLQEIVEQIKKKRSHSFKQKNTNVDSEFRLELRNVPGEKLDLSSRISKYINSSYSVSFSLIFISSTKETDTPIFHQDNISSQTSSYKSESSTGGTLRPNSSSQFLDDMNQRFSKKRIRNPKDLSSNMLNMMEAPLYQCFEVTAINKIYNTPIEMCISGTKMEINPKQNQRSPSSHFTDKILSRFQIKPMNINVEDVVECYGIQNLKNKRQAFKIVYFNGSEYKGIKLEGDQATVEDIIIKLQNVMKMSPSARRNEYKALFSRKKSLSTKVYFKTKWSESSSSDDEDLVEELILSANSGDEARSGDTLRRNDSKFRFRREQ